jgi:putative flippase GtrA
MQREVIVKKRATLTRWGFIILMLLGIIHLVLALWMPYTWGESLLLYLIAMCTAVFIGYYGARLEKQAEEVK